MSEETENLGLSTLNPQEDPALKDVVVSDEDKERFLKSIMSDKPYEEVIPLLGGQVTVRFKAISVQENADITSQILADKKSGAFSETDSYLITLQSYRLALCLVAVDEQPFSAVTKTSFTSLKDGDSYVAARAKPMANWSAPRLAIFLDAFKRFEHKLLKLTNEVMNPNFWKASA